MKYKYNIIYNGATISANSMIMVAKLISDINGEIVSNVYKNLVGRSPSHKQLVKAYAYKPKWAKDGYK